MKNKLILVITFLLFINLSIAQIDENQRGAWYMYFWNTDFGDGPWGIQGDVQYRKWNYIGDLEHLLLRTGLTYSPKGYKTKWTLGYGNIQTGEFGESPTTVLEHRIYQELLYPTKIGKRLYVAHRFRYEQRWVEQDDMLTRYRVMVFLNIPLNNEEIAPKTVYLALYNELFIKGQRSANNEIFDINRLYTGFGYKINDKAKVQLGTMLQRKSSVQKHQLQLSLHHKI